MLPAENVNHYLPDKYKNQSQQRIVLVDGSRITADDIEIIKEIGGDIHLLKEKISNVTSHQDLEVLHEIFDEAKKATAARATALGVILIRLRKER